VRSYPKNNKSKKGWEHGSSTRAPFNKFEALTSNPSTAKKERKKKKSQIHTQYNCIYMKFKNK
jgi:hypothetical protein